MVPDHMDPKAYASIALLSVRFSLGTLEPKFCCTILYNCWLIN